MKSFYQGLPRPFFVLAPMDEVTDTVFRSIVNDCAPPDLYFTEFVNVDGLQSPGRPKLLKKLLFKVSEGPLIAQIWGKDPQNFFLTAKQIADGSLAKELGLPQLVNFVGVDLNMGCPQKSEVTSGTCSALINDRPLAKDIIDATKKGLSSKLPLSIKTRTGFNEIDMTWIEFLLKQDLSMLTIHGRTKREKSKVPANWEVIGEARKIRDKLAPNTLIVGNGDVLSRSQANKLASKYRLDGIMIGRGVFNDPFVFRDTSPWLNYSTDKKLDLYKKHIELFAATWQHNERPMHTLNKFCKIYINGFNGAKELREDLMAANSLENIQNTLNKHLRLPTV